MKYKEEFRDLFLVPNDYCLAHCISADFALGAGIAVEFNRRFDMRNKLKSNMDDYLQYFKYIRKGKGDCLLVDKVFNLITKERCYEKPTYKSIRESLCVMKRICETNNIKKIAMPAIGCGLDQLQWDKVSNIILEVFSDIDVEILVCKVK